MNMASRLIDAISKKTKLHVQHTFSSNQQKKKFARAARFFVFPLPLFCTTTTLFCKTKAACKRAQQLSTLLRQQCQELLRACWQWCAKGCNNSQQVWDLQCIVGRIQPISLCNPCVMSVRGPNNVGRAVHRRKMSAHALLKMTRDRFRVMSLAPRRKCPRNVVQMKVAMAAFFGSDSVANFLPL